MILILGASGMLGHRLLLALARRFDTAGAVRDSVHADPPPALRGQRLVPGLDAGCAKTADAIIERTRPSVVINCVGVIKQHDAAKDAVPSIRINALFPHEVAEMCRHCGARFIHFSTDCVFSGRQGPYNEDSEPDAQDLYGRTKLLGEVAGPGALTLRTSIIGHELRGHLSLLSWFLGQRGGAARGFANALYTGLTTDAMADVVAEIIERHPDLSGLWQVASEAIDKYTLLGKINAAYGLGVRLERDESFHCDRRLDGRRFTQRTGIRIPSWDQMIEQMRENQSQLCPA